MPTWSSGWPTSAMAASRSSAPPNAPAGSFTSPAITNASPMPQPRSRFRISFRCASSAISRAERCGTIRWPPDASRSATLRVLSSPLVGDAVTVTVTSLGTCSATRSATSFSGSTSYLDRRSASTTASTSAARPTACLLRATPPSCQPALRDQATGCGHRNPQLGGSACSGCPQQDARWELAVRSPADRAARLRLTCRSAVGSSGLGRLTGGGVGPWAGNPSRVGDSGGGVQRLAAGLGEPHPLRATVDQAAADQPLGDDPADRPAGDHRGAGIGEPSQGGPFFGGESRSWSWEAPGARGAALDPGPGPSPAQSRPSGVGWALDSDGLPSGR